MKIFKISTYKEYSIFFWLIFVTVIGVSISTIYTSSKNQQTHLIKSSLNNLYLKKTLQEITNNLDPRFKTVNYISKSGDTYQAIINKLDIDNEEKKIMLDLILKEKTLKVLRINQKFIFKFDRISKNKIIEFKIETDKKNEILFSRITNNNFEAKKIKKDFKRKLVYKETIIKNSLYNSAINLGIKPNITPMPL